MTRIKPFQGILYNQKNVADLSKVMCPPYDIISMQDQEKFYNTDPYNFIRVVLGKEKPRDGNKDNKYTRAKQYFDDWLNSNILEKDKTPCFYFYLHEYIYKGRKKKRLGFVGLMKLEHENSKVFPHENTHSKPKEDRLELIRALRANVSPIFAFFYDRERKIADVFQNHLLDQKAYISVRDADNISHKIWRLCDTELINKIKEYIIDEHIFIADGHHRYEVALTFSREMQSPSKHDRDKDGCNYIMTYFTNLDSDDLLILPIHRIVKKVPKEIKILENNFDIERINNVQDMLSSLAKIRARGCGFGLYRNKEFSLLKLKNQDQLKHCMPHGSQQYKCLDVSILQFLIFDRLGIKSEDLIYTKDEDEAIRIVDNNEAEAVFFTNPIKVQQLRDIAFGGEKMPPKSTYFYPKLLSGLVINKFEL